MSQVEIDVTAIALFVKERLPITIMGVEYVPAPMNEPEVALKNIVAIHLYEISEVGEYEEWADLATNIKQEFQQEAQMLLNVIANEVEEFISTLSALDSQAENADRILRFLRGA